MEIRRAVDGDLEAVGAATVAAYADFVLGPDDPYLERLRDAGARAREAELWVAVGDGPDGRVLGSVTSCPPGSTWREIAADDEGEFRMLAVDPAARGRGVGGALVGHVLALWERLGVDAVVISSLPEMAAAHGLYDRFGFRRTPDRDWSPVPGTQLITFRRERPRPTG